jgi:hypothetical protein
VLAAEEGAGLAEEVIKVEDATEVGFELVAAGDEGLVSAEGDVGLGGKGEEKAVVADDVKRWKDCALMSGEIRGARGRREAEARVMVPVAPAETLLALFSDIGDDG